jgi:choice-of-anchor B domain-containing protein
MKFDSNQSRALKLALVMMVGLTATVQADEDGKKLRDKQPPVFGPIIKGDEAKALMQSDNGPFAAKNIELLSWIPLNNFAGNNTSAADMWGYVSPGGQEYAIIGLENGYGFVRVTDPANPVIVGFINGPSSLWHDVTVVGQYAYGASEGGSGIQVINLTNIDAGQVTLVKNWQANGYSSTHTLLSNDKTKFLYSCGSNIANGGLVPIDVSDPINPKFVLNGSGQPIAWTTHYVHECQVVSYETGPYAGKEIAFLYTGGPFNGNNLTGLDIVDVTNKTNLVKLSSLKYPGVQFSHQGWLTEDKKYLYQNDELDEGNSIGVTTTRIFDVSNLSAPVLVKTFTNNNTAIDHNLYTKGNFLYCSNYRSGLRIWDIANPILPKEVGWIDTWVPDDAPQFNGAWGNYPYFNSGAIGISDLEKGLIMVKYFPGSLSLQFVGSAPIQLAPNVATPITISITEDLINVVPSSVALNVSVNGGAFQAFPMNASGPLQFSGAIPSASCFDSVSYYVSAQSTDGRTWTAPDTAPATTIKAQVFTSQTVAFADDMQTNKGWTSGAPGDTATTGKWNRVDPQGTTAQPEDDHTPAPGTICWVTDGNAGSNAGDFDVDNGFTTLLTPIFDLAGKSNTKVSYWRWYSNSAGGNPNADTFRVSISNNGGSTWVPVETVGPSGPETGGGWFFKEFDPATLIPLTANMRMRFIAEDIGGASLVEAAVDDFNVAAVACEATSCYADCDGSGTLNIDDFICFQTNFALGDLAADCDASGNLNIDDFICFQTTFALGC